MASGLAHELMLSHGNLRVKDGHSHLVTYHVPRGCVLTALRVETYDFREVDCFAFLIKFNHQYMPIATHHKSPHDHL